MTQEHFWDDIHLAKDRILESNACIYSAVSAVRETDDAKMLLKSLNRLAFYEILEGDPVQLQEIYREMCTTAEVITCASDLLISAESAIEEGYGSFVLEYMECAARAALRLKSDSVLSILLSYITRIYLEKKLNTELIKSRLNSLLSV